MIPPVIKQLALDKLAEDEPVASVASFLKLKRRTIYDWLNPRPKNPSKRPVGRPRKLKPRTVRYVKEKLAKEKLSSSEV